MVRFLHPDMEAQLARCPEALRLVVFELADWSEANHIEAPLVTCVERDAEQNRRAGGVLTSLHLRQPSRAVDLRNHHYAAWELEKVQEWLRARCPPPRWELVFRTHGTGPHLHVGLEQE